MLVAPYRFNARTYSHHRSYCAADHQNCVHCISPKVVDGGHRYLLFSSRRSTLYEITSEGDRNLHRRHDNRPNVGWTRMGAVSDNPQHPSCRSSRASWVDMRQSGPVALDEELSHSANLCFAWLLPILPVLSQRIHDVLHLLCRISPVCSRHSLRDMARCWWHWSAGHLRHVAAGHGIWWSGGLCWMCTRCAFQTAEECINVDRRSHPRSCRRHTASLRCVLAGRERSEKGL